MSDTTNNSVRPTPARVDKVAGTPAAPTGNVVGNTVIEDAVIAKVAGLAAREVTGVYGLGGGAARAFGAIRDAIGNTDHGQGVHVEVGETQVAVDVTLAVEYPTPMQTVADEVRTAVGRAITELVGMSVAEINVNITDVHIPGDDDASAEESRVQ